MQPVLMKARHPWAKKTLVTAFTEYKSLAAVAHALAMASGRETMGLELT
jgi:hypothetical protein